MKSMIEMLKNWKGAVEIDGIRYDSINDATNAYNAKNSTIHIKLLASVENAAEDVVDVSDDVLDDVYRITVKQYMTKKANPEFDFMAKWNNNEPMPMRTMIGTVEKETPGMVYMNLHADMYAEKMYSCMKCGKKLTNPVSQYFGIGPECGGHNYVNPFDSDEELKAAVNQYRKQLQKVTWTGWIIKSSIIEKEEVH